MYSRITQLEIDTLRVSMDDAVEIFKTEVLPKLREQPGFEGVYVMSTPEGKALLMSFWESEQAAEQSVASGFYAEQLEEHVTLFRAPPGREHYHVDIAELATPISAD